MANKYQVAAPREGFAGVVEGVRFAGGIGYTDDAAVASKFVEMGFAVIEGADGGADTPGE